VSAPYGAPTHLFYPALAAARDNRGAAVRKRVPLQPRVNRGAATAALRHRHGCTHAPVTSPGGHRAQRSAHHMHGRCGGVRDRSACCHMTTVSMNKQHACWDPLPPPPQPGVCNWRRCASERRVRRVQIVSVQMQVCKCVYQACRARRDAAGVSGSRGWLARRARPLVKQAGRTRWPLAVRSSGVLKQAGRSHRPLAVRERAAPCRAAGQEVSAHPSAAPAGCCRRP